MYRDPQQHWDLYQLGEELTDLEDAFRLWRFRHVTTVERVIGFKRGTGGTGGVSYLRKMLDVVLFPEIWTAAHQPVERADSAKKAITARIGIITAPEPPMSAMTFRNRAGKLVDLPTVAASRFKNEFGAIFEQAALGGAVAITKHDTPKAVLLSYAEFESLTQAREPALDDLSRQFDELLQRMQTPKAKAGVAAAFDAAPAQLGRAAVKAARSAKRRR